MHIYRKDPINLLDEVRHLSHPNPILSFRDMMNEYKVDRHKKRQMNGNHTNSIHIETKYHVNMPITKQLSFANLSSASNQKLGLQRKSSMMVLPNGEGGYGLQVRENSRQSISRSENGEVKINQYLIKQLIGRGAFAQVKVCQDTLTDEVYAVKILDLHKLKKKMFSKDPNNKADNVIRGEIAILKKLNHPNIVRLIQVIEDQEYKKVYLIMEYCEKGCINKPPQNQGFTLRISTQPTTLGQKEARQHTRSLLLALDYLHNNVGIAHRDIKPENLLLSSNNQLKLTDFGLSSQDSLSNNKSGTRVYMAPQTYKAGQYDLKQSDIWSLGITLLVLLTGKLPYPDDMNDFDLAQIINNKQFQEQYKDLSPPLSNFLSLCLEKDPSKRATVKQLMKHIWITEGREPLSNRTLELDLEVTQEEKRNALNPRLGRAPPRRKSYFLNDSIQ